MKRRLSVEDQHRMEQLNAQADTCLERATDAMDSGYPQIAREWFEAGHEALRAVRSIEEPWIGGES